ncbi:MAG: pyridoxal-phosphate dependent enzyme, partial [Anaerolineae bacterium]|nr:pyridoxal-phosphate dependent enzyme [Anaerolineae bacterium]
ETGAFKLRGATSKLLSLTAEERGRGVIAVSTGNHGRAVAYVAGQLGITAAVCISERVPENKVKALRQLKAEVVIHGQSQDEAEVRAKQIQDERGATLIPPFDDAHIIAGQGTLGLELLADAPKLDTVLVPLSGGGLIAGVALALKAANPNIRVVGISMERAAVMYRSLQAGQPVQLPEEPTLADSLQGGIGLHNQYTLAMVQQYVDDVILLTEAEIAAGMAFAFFEHHLVLEGAGAVGIAALLCDKVPHLGQHVAVVLSGGNVDMAAFLAVVQEERETGD